MTAHETFQQLVQNLYTSNLHFHLTETPFSAQILLRKKFLKNRIGQSSTTLNFQSEEINYLNNKIAELQKQVKDSNDIANTLEKKLGQAEAEALKVYEENKTKMEALKSSIKNSDFLAKNVTKRLESEQKVAKENEKLIQKLELKCENLAKNNKNIQTELKKVKNENKKLSKNKNDCVDLVQTKQKHEEKDSNQNVPPCSLPSTPRAPSLLLSPPRKVSTPLYTRTPSPKSLATDICAPCGTSPRPSHSTTPPCTPPRATSESGSTATAVCEAANMGENNYKTTWTQPVTTTTYCAPATSSCTSSSPPHSSLLAHDISTSVCSHSPQCTTRQPRSPPSEKCSILVHHGSDYHKHIQSQAGVPYQLGMTHEYCMRIEYENYGCDGCKWFKRWGELHGYPDLNPWAFKEHRQPMTYL